MNIIAKNCSFTPSVHLTFLLKNDFLRGVPVAGIFAAPNNKSNVILKIGDEKLHVSKEVEYCF